MILKGWKYGLFITGMVGVLGAAMYPIAIAPMIDSTHYKNIQKVTRKNVKQEDIQPGNMKVWSDPFAPKKE